MATLSGTMYWIFHSKKYFCEHPACLNHIVSVFTLNFQKVFTKVTLSMVT